MDKLSLIILFIFLIMIAIAYFNYTQIPLAEHFSSEEIMGGKNGFWGQGPINYDRSKINESNFIGKNGQKLMGVFPNLDDATKFAKERGITEFTYHGNTLGEWANTAWTAGNWSQTKFREWAQMHDMNDVYTVILTKKIEFNDVSSGESLSGPLYCKMRVDNGFHVVYNNKIVYNAGNDGNRLHEFTVENVAPNSIVYLVCSNTHATGGLKGEFEFAGRKFYSGTDTIFVEKREVKTRYGNRSSGSKYMGCYKDTNDRDLIRYEGTVANSDECFKRAIMNGKRYFSLQAGNHCFTGNQYGRYGTATNCNMYNKNVWEHGGGSWANEVYDTKQQPNTIEVPMGWNEFNPKAKAVWANTDRSYGTYWFALRIPDVNKVDFCPDPEYEEFNPAACKNPLDAANCASTPYMNFKSVRTICNTPLDYTNFQKMYEQIASVWEIIGNPSTEISKSIRKITNDIYFGDSSKSCANSQWKEKQGKINYFITDSKVITNMELKIDSSNPGLRWVYNFLDINRKLVKTLKPYAEMLNYPIDTTQLSPSSDIVPDTPQYYSLIEKAIKHSQKNNGIIPDRFKKQIKELYQIAIVINGNPKQVRECNCLYLDNNDRGCAPC